MKTVYNTVYRTNPVTKYTQGCILASEKLNMYVILYEKSFRYGIVKYTQYVDLISGTGSDGTQRFRSL